MAIVIPAMFDKENNKNTLEAWAKPKQTETQMLCLNTFTAELFTPFCKRRPWGLGPECSTYFACSQRN